MARARSRSAKREIGVAGVPIEQCLLVQQEIWRIVAEAEREGSELAVWAEARRIAVDMPASGFSLANIADGLVYAAVDLGVRLKAHPAAERPAPAVSSLMALVRGRKARLPERPQPVFGGTALPAAT